MIRPAEREENDKGLSRAAYHAPELQVYGAVKELTNSGSTGVQEKGNSTENPQKRP